MLLFVASLDCEVIPVPAPPMRDSDPQTLAWEAERVRLGLVVACAIRQLMSHVGSPYLMLPYDWEYLEIRRVSAADAR